MIQLLLYLIWIFLCLGGAYWYRDQVSTAGPAGIVGLIVLIVMGMVFITLMMPYIGSPAPYRSLSMSIMPRRYFLG